MKSILLVGLGRFGRHIAEKLNALNHQVMAVDRREGRVDAILPFVTNAQIGDSTNPDFLTSLGIRNFDFCIVAIGDDFQSSLETTSLLKELGAKLVVSRARKVQRFLPQPFFVASQFTGLDGKYVPINETIRGFKEILEGKHDNVPESYFLNAGSIDDVLARM